MGVTEPWMVTTEGQKTWTAACEREISARFNWNGKWGWMPAVMAENVEKLIKLKSKQNARVQEKEISSTKTLTKDPRPLPNSTNHEYGWLVTKPEYQIERFGPFPLTMKVQVGPNLQEIEHEVIRQDEERANKIGTKREAGKEAKLDGTIIEGALEGKNAAETQNPIEQTLMFNPPSNKRTNHHKPSTNSHNLPSILVDPAISQVVKEPGHVRSEGKKTIRCCCTAQCLCKRM